MNQDDIDDIIESTAAAALLYYPEAPIDTDGFDLTSRAAEILEPVDDLEETQRRILQNLIIATIVDPTGNRAALFGHLVELAPEAD